MEEQGHVGVFAASSDQELEGVITGIIANSEQLKSPKLIGVVMHKLKATHGGQYNPKTASDIAKRLLQEVAE